MNSPRTKAVSGNEFFRNIVERILDYIVREMTYAGAGVNDQQLRPSKLPSSATGEGGVCFHSAWEAAGEGEETKLLVWTPDEVLEVLGNDGDDVAGAFMAAYSATRPGNSEAPATGA